MHYTSRINFLNFILIFICLMCIFTLNPVLSSSVILESKTVRSTEAFFIPISTTWFPEFPSGEPLEYSTSLLDMPDLPNWMFSQSRNSSEAFLYGSADQPGTVHIEIVALNRDTFETASRILELKVEPRSRVYRYEVEMKFSNLNVEDMFRNTRLNRLVEVFSSHLWKGDGNIYVTRVVSSLDVGGRAPLNPNMKEGVVVRVGGTSPFSRDLEDLEREVWPLRNRSPCPRDYKRTSAEHFFRNKNFIADWCSFRLISEEQERNAGSSDGWSDHPSVPLTSEEYSPRAQEVPRRDFAFDFVVSVIIPTVVIGVISIALTILMFCSKDEVKNNPSTNVPLEQCGSVQMPDNSLQRHLGKEEDETPSCTESPSSTLPKGCSIRSTSHSGTLRMHAPPPPPYTTNSFPLQSGNIVPCPQ